MIMDFKDLCHARYSVRAFKPDAIPAEKIPVGGINLVHT